MPKVRYRPSTDVAEQPYLEHEVEYLKRFFSLFEYSNSEFHGLPFEPVEFYPVGDPDNAFGDEIHYVVRFADGSKTDASWEEVVASVAGDPLLVGYGAALVRRGHEFLVDRPPAELTADELSRLPRFK